MMMMMIVGRGGGGIGGDDAIADAASVGRPVRVPTYNVQQQHFAKKKNVHSKRRKGSIQREE